MTTSDAIQSEEKIFGTLDNSFFTDKVHYYKDCYEAHMMIQVAYLRGQNRILLEIWIDWEGGELFCNIKYRDMQLLDCDGVPTEEDLRGLVDKLNELLA